MVLDKFQVPFELTNMPAVNHFIGRGADLGHLWKALQPNASNRQKVAILHGTGGMGKTQLAIQFARVYKDAFTAIFWINGQDEYTLIQCLARITSRLQEGPANLGPIDGTKNENELKKDAQKALRWLSQDNNTHWLLIYDNIDQYSPYESAHGNDIKQGTYDIHKYLPSADHGSIIITTRLQQLAELGTISYPVNKLSFSEGVELLKRCSGYTQTCSSPPIDLSVNELAYRLDGLPLAIVLAGSFIRRTGMSLTKYLDHYDRAWRDLQAAAEPHRQYSNGNILTAWAISYHEINKRSPYATQLLYLLSFFSNNDIWYELLQNGLNIQDPPQWFSDVISNEITFSVTVKVLLDFSLVQQHFNTGGYSLHPVVQDWCEHELPRIDIDLEKSKATNWALSTVAVGYGVPRPLEKNRWILQHRLLPHANRIYQLIKYEPEAHSNNEVFSAFHNIGRLFWDHGKLKEAGEMYQRALIGRQDTLGCNHISTLDTIHNIGVLYHDRGDLKDAENTFQKALLGYKKTVGSDHAYTLGTMQNLGNVYMDAKEMDKAEDIYRKILHISETVLHLDRTFILDIIHNLGNLYWNQSKPKEAEIMYQKALSGKEDALGLDHPSTLDTIHNLGVAYYDQGKIQDAEAMYHQALAGKKKALGPEHTSILDTLYNLGGLYHNQRKLKEAEEIYQQVLNGKEKALSQDDFSIAGTAHKLGILYSQQSMFHKAEEMYQRALLTCERSLGPDHISTLDSVHSLGIFYYQQGNLEKAEDMYQKAFNGLKMKFGLNHTSTLGVINNLGVLYQEQGKVKEAKELYQQAISGWEKIFGFYHVSTLGAVHNLGDLCYSQGEAKLATEIYHRVLLGYEKLLGSNHEKTKEVLERLHSLS